MEEIIFFASCYNSIVQKCLTVIESGLVQLFKVQIKSYTYFNCIIFCQKDVWPKMQKVMTQRKNNKLSVEPILLSSEEKTKDNNGFITFL